MDEEHSDECMDDANPISIHEQSECYTCKQYECNEYVRSALARSKVTIREHVSATTQCSSMWTIHSEEHSDDTIIKDQPKAKANHKKYAAVAIKRTQKVAIIKRGP
jgi:hypothetical protein